MHIAFVAISELSHQQIQLVITGACVVRALVHCLALKLKVHEYYTVYTMKSAPPLENEHVKNLDQPNENVIFHITFVDQVKKARNSVFGDICIYTCVPEYSDIRIKNLLAKRCVTKEKLALWLGTVFVSLISMPSQAWTKQLWRRKKWRV